MSLIFILACTFNCPHYGVASSGFSAESCDRLRSACGDFVPLFSDPKCPLSVRISLVESNCRKPGAPRTEDIARIRPTPRWESDFGLNKTYQFPIHCEWHDWTEFSPCSETWYSSIVQHLN